MQNLFVVEMLTGYEVRERQAQADHERLVRLAKRPVGSYRSALARVFRRASRSPLPPACPDSAATQPRCAVSQLSTLVHPEG